MQIDRKTKRLWIRPFEEEDFLEWQRAYSQMLPEKQSPWDLSRYELEFLSADRFQLTQSSQDQEMEEGTGCQLGVFQHNGALVGLVSLMDIIRGQFQNAFLGYRIFNNFWGKGYATEACLAMMNIAFEEYKLHRLEAAISPKNKSSLAVIRKLGFRKEGLSKKRILVANKWEDMEIYAITSEDLGKGWKL